MSHGELARVLAFDAVLEDRLCTHSEAFEWGRALFHSDFPNVYDLNFLRVEDGQSRPSADALAAEAERIQGGAGLRHCKVRVTEERLGRDVEEGFEKLGWNRERTVVMAHHHDPDQRPATGSATRIDLDEMRNARELSLRQETEKKSESEIQQLVDCARLMQERIGARFYGARAGDEIASTCELYSDDATAQIEAVITLEQHRNKGLARAVVMAALDDALAEGHDLVFLVADDDDWPQELYRKLGFEAIGRPFCDFILTPTRLEAMDRSELERLPTEELHDRAMHRARSHADLGFLWSVAKALPAAELASGHPDRSGADIVSLTSLITDFLNSGEGDVGEALRPLYLDYLDKHPG